MKLKTCLEIGNACGLNFLGECVNNILIHSNIFSYNVVEEELTELLKETEIYDNDTSIEAIVDANNWEWYYRTEEDKKYGVYFLRKKEIKMLEDFPVIKNEESKDEGDFEFHPFPPK